MEMDETANQELGGVRHDSMCHDEVCMLLRLCSYSQLAGPGNNVQVCRGITCRGASVYP